MAEPDDYVYYPDYEVYYSNTRRQYIYRDGRSWVSRPQPPRAWARDLPGSVSVHVDFHDAPERHHADIVKNYPKNWRPQPPPRVEERRDDRKEDRK